MVILCICLKDVVKKTVTDDRVPKLIAKALSIHDKNCVQNALLIVKEGCLYPDFQLQKYVIIVHLYYMQVYALGLQRIPV